MVFIEFHYPLCFHGTTARPSLYQCILRCFPVAPLPFPAPSSSILVSREPNYAVFHAAKSDRCTCTARRSDGLRRYKLASMKFNTFARWVFLRLPRSHRVAEKSDPIDRFSGPDLQKITKNRWFLSNFSTTRHDRAKRRKTPRANVSKGRLPIL